VNWLWLNAVSILSLAAWGGMWALGGIWIARAAFNLRRNEQVIAGVGVGMVLDNWLANFLGQVLPLPMAFWAAAGLVLVIGLCFSLPLKQGNLKKLVELPVIPVQIISLSVMMFVFFIIGRGLALLDDYQNLPITSLIAAGDIPPHFALDPNISFGYHYFSLLFAGQIMRIGDVYVWTALDLARGLSFALGVYVIGLFVQRATTSRLAGALGGAMTMFAGGTRWLLLLLPQGLLSRISANVNMIGSGAASAHTLGEALLQSWAASGMGPVAFPFAVVNGFNPTNILTFQAGMGGFVTLLPGLLLLVHNKWRGWYAWPVIAAFLAALGLVNEILLVAFGVGLAIVIAAWVISHRQWKLPHSLRRWLVVLAAGSVIALFQGGVISALFFNKISSFIPGGDAASTAYHAFHFSLIWPPAIISSHLGSLTLTNPYQLLVAMIEIGPILLVLPLVAIWMIKALRFQRWYEGALGASAFASLALVCVHLSGTAGSTALTRAQNLLFSLAGVFAVPALWLLGRHRSDKFKIWIGILLVVIMLGGVVLFGIELVAAPYPVMTDFIAPLDARMSTRYWNALENDAMVFDSVPYRSPVVFGRPNQSSTTWYERTPEWKALLEAPNPYQLAAEGYRYIYVDKAYWNNLNAGNRRLLQYDCIKLKDEIGQEFPNDFRRLLDIRACR
jgi:hypothetical protein